MNRTPPLHDLLLASNAKASHPALFWLRGQSTLFPQLDEQISWQTWRMLLNQSADKIAQQFPDTNVIAYQGTQRFPGLLFYAAALLARRSVLMLNPTMPDSLRDTLLPQLGISTLLREDFFADFPPQPTACARKPHENPTPFTLTLTSGSTGLPKAAAHDYPAHWHSAAGVCRRLGFSAEHRWLLSLPLFHISGQAIVWRWLSQGAQLVINEDKADFWQALETATHASLVPTQLQRYLQRLQQGCQTPAPKTFLLGGAHIPAELVTQAQAYPLRLFSGYGMTEAASTVCMAENALDHCGKPLAAHSVRLVQNEIQLKSTCLAQGYWQQNRLIPLPQQDGWFATKDLGQWNAQGQLVVIGRKDNMFISGGENIQPEEVEKTLLRSGLLQQIFIVPVADPEFGQRAVAWVEFHEPFGQQAVNKLQHFAQTHLEPFKRPVRYLALTQAAHSGGIKHSRQQLRRQAENSLLSISQDFVK